VTGEAEKMITITAMTSAALDEAAAIVEAEWMRLQRQSAPRVEDHFAEPTESPAPRKCPPRVAIGVARVRRPGPSATGMGSQLIPKGTRLGVWATERSPPVG
jgi:hypothetical protein